MNGAPSQEEGILIFVYCIYKAESIYNTGRSGIYKLQQMYIF